MNTVCPVKHNAAVDQSELIEPLRSEESESACQWSVVTDSHHVMKVVVEAQWSMAKRLCL